LKKLPSVMLTHICGTNSHNQRAKGQPGVGVVKFFPTPTRQFENPSDSIALEKGSIVFSNNITAHNYRCFGYKT